MGMQVYFPAVRRSGSLAQDGHAMNSVLLGGCLPAAGDMSV